MWSRIVLQSHRYFCVIVHAVRLHLELFVNGLLPRISPHAEEDCRQQRTDTVVIMDATVLSLKLLSHGTRRRQKRHHCLLQPLFTSGFGVSGFFYCRVMTRLKSMTGHDHPDCRGYGKIRTRISIWFSTTYGSGTNQFFKLLFCLLFGEKIGIGTFRLPWKIGFAVHCCVWMYVVNSRTEIRAQLK